jgi:4-hydroxy-tetrahydrodipicolinate synthase
MMRGVYTALVTPFKNGKLDISSWRKLLERQAAAHIHGVVVAGTTGESPTLCDEELMTLMREAQVFRKELKLMMGVGGNNTEKVVRLAKLAGEVGADAVLAVAPYYNKPPQWALLEHFREVARQSPVPMMLYNVPGRTGVDVLGSTSIALSKEKNICGIKECAGLERFTEVRAGVTSKSFALFTGDDPVFLPALEKGADGIVSVLTNVWPEGWVKLFGAFSDGDLGEAKKIFGTFAELNKILFSVSNPIGIKWFGSERGYWADECRLPLVALSASATPADVQRNFKSFSTSGLS